MTLLSFLWIALSVLAVLVSFVSFVFVIAFLFQFRDPDARKPKWSVIGFWLFLSLLFATIGYALSLLI